MPEIALSSIVIKPNRQRREFDPTRLLELQASIEWSEGNRNAQLQNPPVLRREGDTMVLVSGESRLKVISDIFALGGSFAHNRKLYTAEAGLVPYTDMGEMSELEAFEAELDENIRRNDLTWQEKADATRKLHELRGLQAKARQAAIVQATVDAGEPEEAAPQAPAHTVRDTAMEIHGRADGDFQNRVRKELIVAKHLDNPDVAKAKSVDEAYKILKKQEAASLNAELAKVVGATFSSEAHRIHNMNCLDFMRGVADGPESEKFDVILTDPPYGMGADTFGDAGGKLTGIEHHYDDSYESWLALMREWAPLSFAVAKPQAHAYVFCDFDNFHKLKEFMLAAGWYVFRTPLIVHKLNSGRVPLPDQGPRRQYEIILYAIKGKKPVTHIYSDVISVEGDKATTHGAQKPVALYQNLLQRSVRPGDRVFDAFGGTGTLIPAAHTYKCSATVTELNPEYYGLCLRRVQDLKILETPAMI